MKKCSSCHQIKPIIHFHKDNRQKDGLQPGCKECRKITSSNYYLKNKQKAINQAKESRKKIKAIVNNIKESNPCVDCNTYYPFYVMDFDHLRDKSFKISWGIINRSRDNVLKEIEKCELVCSNCHRKRSYKRQNNRK